ncbi:T9SS type A sorting domain-containing protein [Bacteroidota bacterium]
MFKISATRKKVKVLSIGLILTMAHLVLFAQHTNVMISNSPSIEEPSIMLNPANPMEMVAGANLNYVFSSTNGGQSWTEKILTSTYGVWGDPCIIIDNDENFYYFHLANPPKDSGEWIDRMVCQKTTDKGATWSGGSYTGLNGTKVQDKEWATVDRRSNTIYLTWTQFDVYGNLTPPKPGDSTHIMFSKTMDGGQSWSKAVRIDETGGDCYDDDNAVEGAVPAVGPGGELYVCWIGPLGLMFDRSMDSGKTWLQHDIKVSDVPGGWNYMIPGIYRCNGLPVICVDTSTGPNQGTIYINWSDQRNGINNTDIWLVKSTDGGNSWTAPAIVNNDNSNRQQFFTWMTIDQSNGYLYFVFYDRRNHADNYTDVYLAVSKDGGEHFSNHRISETAFLPYQSIFFGDYTNIVAHQGVVRPIWARLDTTSLSVWTAIIDTSFSSISELVTSQFSVDEAYPNPFNNTTYISFKLHSEANVNLTVTDLHGREICTLLNADLNAGKYIEHLNAGQYSMVPGIYIFRLRINDHITFKKIIYSN